MQKRLAALWFQPYTPVIIVILIIAGIAKGVYPTVQKAISAQKVEVPLPTSLASPTPFPDDKSFLEAVGKLMMLPSDENPQVIPITQIEQFKDQPFFRHAKNGDIILIYTNNKKVILYNWQENKIIDVAPLAAAPPNTLGAQSSQPQQSSQSARPTPTATPTPTQSEPTSSPTPQNPQNPTETPIPTALPSPTP